MTKLLFQNFEYENVQDDFKTMLEPFKQQRETIRKGHCEIIDAGTKYTKEVAEIEVFMRLLWGASPYYVQNEYDEFFFDIVKGITEGTNPNSKKYWGDLFSYNQMLVEVASFAIFIIEHEEILKKTLTEEEFENIKNWIDQMNTSKPHPNNWIFFRVLSNMSLELVFNLNRREQMNEDLDRIEKMYLGDGWYMDGRKTQKDYYISFAFHYYSLLYAEFFKEQDPKRAKTIHERAIKFAHSFQHWFDEKGRGLPFGRSLTYRFAQSSFWTMLIYSGINDYPMEYSKYFLANNLKNWFQQEIMTPRYELSLGYYYHNMNMLEEYNAYGSPYWAFKTFRFLALPKDHKLYTLETKYPENLEKTYYNEKMGMIIQHTESGVRTYPLDQEVYHHTNGKAKYEKVVYSTEFGFNASKGPYGMMELCFDNVFALSEQDELYRSPDHVKLLEANSKYFIKHWQAFSDVSVHAITVPLEEWHIRVHYINAGRKLRYLDTGFSTRCISDTSINAKIRPRKIDTWDIDLQSSIIKGDKKAEVKISEVLTNTNLLHNRVIVPYVVGNLEIGDHVICDKFYGGKRNENLVEPEVNIEGTKIIVTHKNETITIDVSKYIK